MSFLSEYSGNTFFEENATCGYSSNVFSFNVKKKQNKQLFNRQIVHIGFFRFPLTLQPDEGAVPALTGPQTRPSVQLSVGHQDHESDCAGKGLFVSVCVMCRLLVISMLLRSCCNGYYFA